MVRKFSQWHSLPAKHLHLREYMTHGTKVDTTGQSQFGFECFEYHTMLFTTPYSPNSLSAHKQDAHQGCTAANRPRLQ
jgi:hypothetical protein